MNKLCSMKPIDIYRRQLVGFGSVCPPCRFAVPTGPPLGSGVDDDDPIKDMRNLKYINFYVMF